MVVQHTRVGVMAPDDPENNNLWPNTYIGYIELTLQSEFPTGASFTVDYRGRNAQASSAWGNTPNSTWSTGVASQILPPVGSGIVEANTANNLSVGAGPGGWTRYRTR